MTTLKTKLRETANGQANYLNVNEALAQIDQLLQAAALDKDLAAPPGSPTDGALYIVAASPTGAWSGKAGQLAYWLSSVGAWTFIAPNEGFLVHVNDENTFYKFDGSAWVAFSGGSGSSWPGVITETTTARTLADTDAGKYLRTTNGAAVTITVPPQSAVAWSADTEVHVEQGGAGQVTIAAGSGVTINRVASTSAKTKGQYAVLTLKRISADVWTLFGYLEPTA